MLKAKVRKHPEVWLTKFKKEYAALITQKDDNIKKMQELLANPVVAEYVNLMSANKKIATDQRWLYMKIKNIEYLNCKHLWINVPNYWDFDDEKEEPAVYHACLKCGLNEKVILEGKFGTDFYNYEYELMYYFMQEYNYKHGIVINATVRLDVAREIYSRIKANHPDIEDEQMKKYMEIALCNMQPKMQHYLGENKVLKRLFPNRF